jgi:hypothetical protein
MPGRAVNDWEAAIFTRSAAAPIDPPRICYRVNDPASKLFKDPP